MSNESIQSAVAAAEGLGVDQRPAIQTRALARRFGRNTVLTDVELSVPRGSVYALLGRNGAGKSTLLQILLGTLDPSEGAVTVLGLDPRRQGVELRRRIGYIPERMPLYDWMTVDQIVSFTAAQYQNWSKDEEVRLVQKFRLDRRKKVRELSRGNLALLALVLAMANQPEVVLLDECTSGMDAVFRAEFDRTVIETLREADRTVLFASHQIRELEFISDWVGILHHGRLMLQMPVDDLKAEVKSLRLRTPAGAEPPKLNGELSRQSLGREWLVTVRDANSAAAFLPAHAELLDTIDLTLEQIFVALTTEEDERR